MVKAERPSSAGKSQPANVQQTTTVALKLVLHVATAAPPEKRLARRYLECLADMIQRHILGPDIRAVDRRERWQHILAILRIEGEQIPESWRACRVGGVALLAEITRALELSKEATHADIKSEPVLA